MGLKTFLQSLYSIYSQLNYGTIEEDNLYPLISTKKSYLISLFQFINSSIIIRLHLKYLINFLGKPKGLSYYFRVPGVKY